MRVVSVEEVRGKGSASGTSAKDANERLKFFARTYVRIKAICKRLYRQDAYSSEYPKGLDDKMFSAGPAV